MRKRLRRLVLRRLFGIIENKYPMRHPALSEFFFSNPKNIRLTMAKAQIIAKSNPKTNPAF